jgi:hypothetical protein
MLRHNRRTRVMGYPDSGLKPSRFCRVGVGFQCLTTANRWKGSGLAEQGADGALCEDDVKRASCILKVQVGPGWLRFNSAGI